MQTLALVLDRAATAVLWGGLAALALSMLVACIVLIRAREVADRAIAFDLTMVHVVGIIALAAIAFEQLLLLDTLIVVSVLGFLGTVTIARYLERGLPAALRQRITDTNPRRDGTGSHP